MPNPTTAASPSATPERASPAASLARPTPPIRNRNEGQVKKRSNEKETMLRVSQAATRKAPSTKLQAPGNHQAPTSKHQGNFELPKTPAPSWQVLALGHWRFPGAWSLELGAFFLAACTAPAAASTAEQNWPQWRGPLQNGVAPHANPPVTWSETNNIKWKVKIPG